MTTMAETYSKLETANTLAYTELEQSVYLALQTYSNVHRGSGQFSQVTTAMLEQAREMVLDYLMLDKSLYVAIFCSPFTAGILIKKIEPHKYFILSSHDIGLPFGLRVIAVKRQDLPKGVPSITGGGMIKLVSKNSLVLANLPDRFEAGTPAIVNIIAFAKALQIIEKNEANPFFGTDDLCSGTTAKEILSLDNLNKYSGKELLLQLRKTLIGKEINVPVTEGDKDYTNLDNAASTPVFMPVWEAVNSIIKQPFNIQKQVISETKEICSGFFNAPLNEYETVFCSNTTEAINIAVRNIELSNEGDIEPVVLNTNLEHHSNELPWRYSSKVYLLRMAANDEGFVDIKELELLLKNYNHLNKFGKKRIKVVAITGISNVLGTYNDLKEIARVVHKYDARILVDGAQLVAHRKVSMLEHEIDYLALSGHKMYAPFGGGLLIARKKLINFRNDELIAIKASGEENIVGIAALGKAMMLLNRIGMNIIQEEEIILTKKAIEGLSKIQGLNIYGITDTHSDNFYNKGGIIVFSMKNVPHNIIAKELAEIGAIGVRTGCFCAHLLTKKLMGITPFRGKVAEFFLNMSPGTDTSTLPGIVRISFGIENDEQDVDHFLEIMQKIAEVKRSFEHRFTAYMHNGATHLPMTETHERIMAFVKSRIRIIYDLNSVENF